MPPRDTPPASVPLPDLPLPGLRPESRADFVLAHVSDLHLPHTLAAWPTSLLNKRVIGYLSWRLRRVRVHRREVLDALVDDVARAEPDHVAVTGDIVNIALPGEFRRAGAWLRGLGPPSDVSVVPGNHDAYVAVSWERSWSAWDEFTRGDPGPEVALPPSTGEDGFPYLRRRGPLALIGLSTAVPTAPGRASGLIGPSQLGRLAALLRRTEAEGLFRVILLHHPPVAPEIPRHKRLLDAPAFAHVVAEAGAELVLHGHEHRFRFAELPGPIGAVPVYGVPSASMLPRRDGERAAQYHLYRIGVRHDGWTIETEIRSYSRAHHRFLEARRVAHLVPSGVSERARAPGSTPGATV